jgi:hypothetical protein
MFTTSNYQELYWPISNDDDIALSQALIANTPLNLNGRFSNQNTYKNIDFSYNNKLNASVVRKLTLTSTDDIRGVNFVIYGRQNGVDIIETIAGPNRNTAASTNDFDYIYKIEHNSVGNENIEIGTVSTGFFTLTTLDVKNYRKSLEYGINLITNPINVNNVVFDVYGSLNRKKGLYQNLINTGYFYKLIDPDITTLTSKFSDIKATSSLILIKISANAGNKSITAQILQI